MNAVSKTILKIILPGTLLLSLFFVGCGKEEQKAQTVFETQMAELKKENELLEQKLILKDLAFDLRIREKDRKKKK